MRVLCSRNTSATSSGILVFSRRVFLFVLSVVFLVFLLFAWARYLSHKNLELDDNVSIIVCGDSHTQSAINDSVLSSSINISFTSQPYFFTFSVLRFLIECNPQIETVILGYSFHSLSPIMDTILFDSETALENALNRDAFLALTDLSYVCKIFYNDPVDIFVLLARSSLRHIWQQVHSNDIHDMLFIGGYYSSFGQNMSIENVEAAVQRHYYKQSEGYEGIAVYQPYYLHRRASLCKDNNVEMYLVNTPISEEYYNKIPRAYISNYYYIASEVDAALLDYHDFQLPDSCYGDADHLNYYGAIEFSKTIDSLMN